MFHFHSWFTVRDDGYWYYQQCLKCRQRRTKAKEHGLSGQPPNPVWAEGGELPKPIGEGK